MSDYCDVCSTDLVYGYFTCEDCGNRFCLKCYTKSRNPYLASVCDGCLSNKKVRDAINNKEHWKVSDEELLEYLLDRFGLTKEEAQRHCLVSKLNME